MAHLLDHHPQDGAPVPVSGRVFQQVALLLHAGKFGVSLVDDHVHQRVAHLLRRHLPQVLPLAAAFVRSELNLFGVDRAIQRVKVEGINLSGIDANILAPVVKQTNPVTEGSDFCNFARHKSKSSFFRRNPQFAVSPQHSSNRGCISQPTNGSMLFGERLLTPGYAYLNCTCYMAPKLSRPALCQNRCSCSPQTAEMHPSSHMY